LAQAFWLTRANQYHFNFEKVTDLSVIMSKMNILILLSMNTALALKLQQSPEFDMEGSIYDEECGDRYNYKCWKKGGHSLDKEEAAYITTIAWGTFECASLVAPLQAGGATRTTGSCIPSVLVTFDKAVDVSKCDVTTGAATDTVPFLKINFAATFTDARCSAGDTTRTLTFLGEDIAAGIAADEFGDCHINPDMQGGNGNNDAGGTSCDGSDTQDRVDNSVACGNDADNGAGTEDCIWVAPSTGDTLTIGTGAINVNAATGGTIKNAGKSKNVNVANSAAQGCAGTQPCGFHTVVPGTA